jgi:broad specificity phosphatase PhoE
MTPTILLIRHGNTTYDERVDAFLDPPLNEEGVKRVGRTVAFLDTMGFEYDRIVSSPRQRALRVAEMISRGNIKVTTNNSCLPWNLGDLMGKKNALVGPYIEFLKEYPDLKAPHGESYRTFYNRWEAFLHRAMLYAKGIDKTLVITAHSRNIDSLQEIIGGAPLGDFKPLTPEASVTKLSCDENGDWSYELIWNGDLAGFSPKGGS